MERLIFERNNKCDKDIEERFGKPLWGLSSMVKGVIYTPLATPGIWRVDKLDKDITWNK